jgi:hypothetical protein
MPGVWQAFNAEAEAHAEIAGEGNESLIAEVLSADPHLRQFGR